MSHFEDFEDVEESTYDVDEDEQVRIVARYDYTNKQIHILEYHIFTSGDEYRLHIETKTMK